MSLPARPHRPVALLAVVTAVLVALGWGAGPAGAHTGLADTAPPVGAAVAEPVAEVTLTFTGPVEVIDGGVQVFDADGAEVDVASLDQPRADTVVVVPAEALAGGEHGVRWSVRATDGHVLSDAFSFTVTAPAPAAAPGGPSGGGSASTAAPPSTATSPAPSGVDGPATRPVASEAAGSDALASALAASAPDTTGADLLGLVARALVYAGVLLSVGGLVYLLYVHEGSTGETRRIVHWIRRAAAVVVAATGVQALAMVAGWHDGSFFAVLPPQNWWHTFGNQSGVGLALAAGGGVAILAGLQLSMEHVTRRLPVDGEPAPASRRSGTFDEATGLRAGPPAVAHGGVDVETATVDVQLTRLHLADSRLALVGAVAVVASFLFLGHTVSEGFRPLTALADAVHVGAAGTWGAGAVLLAAALRVRRGRPDALPGVVLVSRFARVATMTLVLVALTGLALSWAILPDVGALWSSTFGRLLVAKVAVVAGIVVLGAHNHLRLVPALEADPLDGEAVTALRRSVGAEAVGFVVVIVLTAVLVAASPT